MTATGKPQSAADPSARPAIIPGVDLGRPVRMGVIINPQSGRNRRRGTTAKLTRVLADYPDVRYALVQKPEDIAAATLDLLDQEVEMIAINGGDGTTHAVLTALLRSRPPEASPLLAVFPGGTTNTTANDVGTREHPRSSLPRLLAAARAGRLEGVVERRAVMRVQISPDSPPLFGAVFGAGAVYHGVKYCHEHIYTKGIYGEIASGLTVAAFAWKVVRGQTGTLFPPLHVWGQVDGKEMPQRESYGLVIATVRRIFLGMRPFWGDGPGAMQFSILSYRPEHLLRALGEMLREKPGPYLLNERCFTSQNADEIVLNIDSGFIVDGELYLPKPGTPIVLRSDCSVPFLRPIK